MKKLRRLPVRLSRLSMFGDKTIELVGGSGGWLKLFDFLDLTLVL